MKTVEMYIMTNDKATKKVKDIKHFKILTRTGVTIGISMEVTDTITKIKWSNVKCPSCVCSY